MTVGKCKLATSRDVVRLAGVSRATVSNFFSGAKYVGLELPERVAAAIQQLSNRPNCIAAASDNVGAGEDMEGARRGVLSSFQERKEVKGQPSAAVARQREKDW